MYFHSQHPWFIFAPHLHFPLRNGADIYVAGLAKGISGYVAGIKVTLVSANEIRVFNRGEEISQTTFKNQIRTKYYAAIRTLTKQSSYQIEKFITPSFINRIKSLDIPAQSNLVYSFNSSLILSKYFTRNNHCHIVLTHNFDPHFFTELAKASGNLITKVVFNLTARYTINLLLKYQEQFIFAHINEADMQQYKKMFQQMHHAIFKAGVDDADVGEIVQKKSETDATIKLCFCGGLSSLQNFQALEYFSLKFWPDLSGVFGAQLQFFVIGSNPTSAVTVICKTNGWQLYANLEDDKFNEIVSLCSFSILPFEHTSGSKLKLLTCLARGTPFIATNIIESQADVIYPASCLFSDDSYMWIKHLQHWDKLAKQAGVVQENVAFAQQFSWQKTAASFIESLKEIVAINH